MNTKGIILQSRDRVLLKYLCEFGYLNIRQIESKVLLCHRKRAFRRLKKLKDAGLLELWWRKDRVGTRVYSVLPKNLTGILDQDVLGRAQITNSNKSVFSGIDRHEDLVRDVALEVLLLQPEAAFDLEHHLSVTKSGYRIKDEMSADGIPDILFNFREGGKLAIEIELTQKSRERYLKKFRDLNHCDWKTILYVVSNCAIGESVRLVYQDTTNYLKAVGRAKLPRLLVCSLEEARDPIFIRSILLAQLTGSTRSLRPLHEVNPEDIDLRVESEARKLGA